MSLHAVLGPQALKTFTKTLTCLSRYGDDVVIQAKSDALILLVTNSSRTAHSNITLASAYFDKYILKPLTQSGMTFQTSPETEDVTGQLLVKSLLSILRHKTVEKTVDRCDLSIVEGGQDSAHRDNDDIFDQVSLSSKLILRLHCKHGVVKTHRLLLFVPNATLVAPQMSDVSPSHLAVGPGTLRDLLDHFPHLRGDPQLVWNFAANNVVLRSIESLRARDRGVSQLATEISLSADEFDSYSIENPPVSISFHLREFNATIILAESLSVALTMKFTSPAEPLTIKFETDTADIEYVFVISTIQNRTSGKANPLKRVRGEGGGDVSVAVKKPFRAADSTAFAPLPSSGTAPQAASHLVPVQGDNAAIKRSPPRDKASHAPNTPLFLPGVSQDTALPPPASQFSAADLALVRSAGLGIEHMDYEEFEAMMEAEGEEVGTSTALQEASERLKVAGRHNGDNDGIHLVGEFVRLGSDLGFPDEDLDVAIEASQMPAGRHGDREFQPLFDD